MSSTPQFHIGYVDGVNRSSQNVASTAWVIFSPSNEFLDSEGIFLGRTTNNLAKYEAVIALMTNASTLGIHSLVVRLDSKISISQLTSCYSICHPRLYWKYLRVCFLERSFDVIFYEHIPRALNSFADSLDNDLLDWHLSR
jgi:ribonuclease HI